MQFVELLSDYQKQVDPLLRNYFDKKLEEARKNDALAVEAIEMIADFTLASGKRMRPAVMYYAYLAAGGKDEDAIKEASVSIELVHTFLLIHDDIIDRDEKRHGVSTLHERYKKIARILNPKKDSTHFGNSMAMIVGDMTSAMANEVIFNTRFDARLIIRALDMLQRIVYVTIPGEMLDVLLEFKGSATEKEIMDMHERKTAKYTFEGPMYLGAVLAGNEEHMLEPFSRYALAAGKAFQLQDDILGVFGDEKKLGKPVGSDIIEGKQTLLVIKALAAASSSQKSIIHSLLGKKDLSESELQAFRSVIRDTGALDYSVDLSKKLIAEAIDSLQVVEFKNAAAKDFFEGAAQYVISREY